MGKTIKSLRRNPDAPLWRDVLKSIKAKPKLAFYFAKPVDHVALNIPLYPTIVKTPMDLQTIERKLAANEYAELDDFATDVLLVLVEEHGITKNESHVLGKVVELRVLICGQFSFYSLEVHGSLHYCGVERDVEGHMVHRFGKIKPELRLGLDTLQNVAP